MDTKYQAILLRQQLTVSSENKINKRYNQQQWDPLATATHHSFGEGQAIVLGRHLPGQADELLLVLDQRERRIVQNEHLDDDQATLVARSGHLEKPRAAQTVNKTFFSPITV